MLYSSKKIRSGLRTVRFEHLELIKELILYSIQSLMAAENYLINQIQEEYHKGLEGPMEKECSLHHLEKHHPYTPCQNKIPIETAKKKV